MSELKPCPFCGGEASMTGYGGIYSGCCNGCSSSGSIEISRLAAAAAWNIRSRWQDDRVTELELALTRMVDIYTTLVNCGDCGNWNPETEVEVMVARAALAPRKEKQDE